MKGVPFVNRRYTKGVPFSWKMVYKRVRGWTSGRSLPVWKHVSPFHFLGKQNSSKCRSFWRVNIVGIRFAERKCYNTSCYRYIRLLGSLTLPSETAVEAIFAPSNKFYRKKSLGAPGMKVPNDSSVGHAASRHVVYVISGAKVFLNHYS